MNANGLSQLMIFKDSVTECEEYGRTCITCFRSQDTPSPSVCIVL